MKIFIAGPRVIKELDENITIKLNNICEKQYDVLIGDAEGIDSSVQKFLQEKLYKNVKIYASNGIARNNYGGWKIENVQVNKNITGFEFYTKKDYKMAEEADIGFMIWNGKSKGTFNNIINLLNLNKDVFLYYSENKKFYNFTKIKDFEKFINNNLKISKRLINMLPKKEENNTYIQACLF